MQKLKQAKKIFTRMLMNNWGGVSHKIMEFHEYVNLFSGKSGSGKSTVMDAIQVVLYGSISATFLNKAADDAKNRRSVLSYLRGAQKDGSYNRDGQDFCSQIVLEIFDTGNEGEHMYRCCIRSWKKMTVPKVYVFQPLRENSGGRVSDGERCAIYNCRTQKACGKAGGFFGQSWTR